MRIPSRNAAIRFPLVENSMSSGIELKIHATTCGEWKNFYPPLMERLVCENQTDSYAERNRRDYYQRYSSFRVLIRHFEQRI